ncbi:MAG TPA: ABC transporter permease [Bryobacterales bacterium]|nr:ABC transporter permease [Bryobacterales bacterium]
MFVRLVRQSLARSPRRKLLTIVAVALASSIATAMLAVLFDIGDRVSRELRSFGANLQVTAKSAALPVEIGGVDYRPVAEGPFIPDSALPRLKSTFWRNNITAFAPFLSATVELGNSRVVVQGTWFRRRYTTASGEALSTGVRDLNQTWRVAGEWIDDAAPDPAAREALVGSALARRLGLQPGGRITLWGEPFLVRGVVETGGEEENQVFTRLETVERFTSRPGEVSRVQVGALTKPEDAFARKDPTRMTPAEYERWYCTPYVSSIARQIEEQLPMAVARPIRRIADNEGRILGQIRLLMLLVSLAAMITAGLLIWSAMATTVLERRSEIAVMKAVGAQSSLIAALFAVEVGLQGALGGIIGVAAGVFLARRVSLQVFHSPLELSPLLPALVIVAAVLVALAGSAVPMRSALRLEVAPILKEES